MDGVFFLYHIQSLIGVILQTRLQFDIPNEEVIQSISLNIFDIKGRQVETLVNGSMLPGSYHIQWHANQFASGMYFAKLVYGTKIKTQKILLLK